MNEIQKVKIDVMKQTIPVFMVAIFGLASFITLNIDTMSNFVMNAAVLGFLFLIAAMLLVFIMIYDSIMQMKEEER